MKIAELKTFVVGNPPPHHGGRYFIFVKLTTACGIDGVGEVYAATFGPQTIVAMIEDVFARHVEGRNPLGIEAMWRAVYGSGFSLRPDISLMGVLSGLEMACWDIAGKAADRPVHDLLGGKVRERLRTYTYLYPPHGNVYPDPDDGPNVYANADIAADVAASLVADGFTAVKFDPAGPYTVHGGRQPSLEELDRSEAFVKTIRALARRLQSYDPLWFEEPVPPEMPEEMAKVARATTIPVATGERLTTKYEFARVLATGAASILQMNLGRVGGVLEAKKIAGMAEAHYAQIAPHLYCGPVVGAANIQIAACSPNFLILEGIGKWDGFHAEILNTPIRWQNGHVIVPAGPGLGVELNEAVAEAHSYEGKQLHLEMSDEPL
jgi:L-alanine-DL-glutamate epimerase-like enolase superfamily enzyme